MKADNKKSVEQSGILSAEDVYEVIESRISYFKEIYHKYEAIQLNNALHVIKNLIPPKQFEGKELPEEIDATRNLLADIIAWELDLSNYADLESILRATYIIKKKEGVNSPTKEQVDKILKSVQPKELPEEELRKELVKFAKWFSENMENSITDGTFKTIVKEYLKNR
jgi:hypothetical protein